MVLVRYLPEDDGLAWTRSRIEPGITIVCLLFILTGSSFLDSFQLPGTIPLGLRLHSQNVLQLVTRWKP